MARVARESIKEVPMTHGNPDEPYYRLIIREWIPLVRPILPHEAGFVREFTNIFLLEHAEYVPELLLRSEEEYRFYAELKRRTNAAIDDDAAKPGFEIGDTRILFEDGKIRMYRDGRAIAERTVQEFSNHPNATFRRLYAYMEHTPEAANG